MFDKSSMMRMYRPLLFVGIAILCSDHCYAQQDNTYTSGVYSAWMGDSSDGLTGDINVFLTKDAFENAAFGMNGAVFGLPVNATQVRVVLHAGGECDDPGPAMEFSIRQELNRTLSIVDGVGYLEFQEKFDPTIFYEDDIVLNPVSVYLQNGVQAGCGYLAPVPDSSILESILNSFPDGPGFFSSITMLVSPNYPTVCFFGTAVGIESDIGESAVCGEAGRPANKCGIQVRQQSGCEEDTMAPTIFDPLLDYDPWTWSRYYWSTVGGSTFFSQCINVGWEEEENVIDRLEGSSFIVYNSEGVGIGCGAVNYYTPPPAEVFQSDVFCAYVKDHPDDDKADGFIFVFQNTEAIRNGVMGVAGYGYRPELEQCQNGTCELVVFKSSECGDDMGDPVLVGALEFDTEGSFFGVLDVVKEDMEDWTARIRLADGTFESCDTLKEVPDSIVYQTKTEPYLGRSGAAEIVSALAFHDELCSFGVVYGLESNINDCSGGCLYHVNEGMSCDEPNGHLFSSLHYSESPWKESRYVRSDEYGVAFLGGCVATEFDDVDFEGHAVVIRGPDNLPASCGILKAFEPLVDSSFCNICPLDGYEFSKPNQLVNFGGSVDVSCAEMKDTAESFRATTDQCIDVQQVTSKACGCSQDTLQASKSSRSSIPVVIGAIAAFVIIGLTVAVFFFSRKASGNKTPKAHSTVGDLMLEQQQTDRGQDQRTPHISESLFSRAEQGPAVATAVHEPIAGGGSNRALTSKNQLQGESFWQDRDGNETPYARVVSVETPEPEDSMAAVKMMDSDIQNKNHDSESSF